MTGTRSGKLVGREESSVLFSAGTLLVDGRAGDGPGIVWDERASRRRAPAYLFGAIAARADASGDKLVGDLRGLEGRVAEKVLRDAEDEVGVRR